MKNLFDTLRRKKKQENLIPNWNNCDFLPAWRFFAVIDNNQDYRYLLKCDELPENYDTEYLGPVWDEICNQYDKMNGESVFKNKILDTNENVLEITEIIKLKAAFGLMQLGDEKGCSYFGFKKITPENLQKARSLIIKKQTRVQIKDLERRKPSKKQEENYYIHAIVWLSNLLNRQLDKDKITVSEWVYWNKEAKKHIANLKQHGRSSKVK